MLGGQKRLISKLSPFLVLAAVAFVGVGLLFGDGCGPVERGIRAMLGKWDMWDTIMLAPYEEPLSKPPKGAVPMSDPGQAGTYATAHRAAQSMEKAKRNSAASKAYRRYCYHCHGPKADGRIIVGESFGFEMPDLRSEDIQDLDNEDIFDILTEGSGRMLALKSTMTPLERVLAILYLRGGRGFRY